MDAGKKWALGCIVPTVVTFVLGHVPILFTHKCDCLPIIFLSYSFLTFAFDILVFCCTRKAHFYCYKTLVTLASVGYIILVVVECYSSFYKLSCLYSAHLIVYALSVGVLVTMALVDIIKAILTDTANNEDKTPERTPITGNNNVINNNNNNYGGVNNDNP